MHIIAAMASPVIILVAASAIDNIKSSLRFALRRDKIQAEKAIGTSYGSCLVSAATLAGLFLFSVSCVADNRDCDKYNRLQEKRCENSRDKWVNIHLLIPP